VPGAGPGRKPKRLPAHGTGLDALAREGFEATGTGSERKDLLARFSNGGSHYPIPLPASATS